MTKKIIYSDALIVSNTMCLDGCGQSVEDLSIQTLQKLKAQGLLPDHAELIFHAAPEELGYQRVMLELEAEEPTALLSEALQAQIRFQLKKTLADAGFDSTDGQQSSQQSSLKRSNWINILINVDLCSFNHELYSVDDACDSLYRKKLPAQFLSEFASEKACDHGNPDHVRMVFIVSSYVLPFGYDADGGLFFHDAHEFHHASDLNAVG